jgi:hypothetical protein
MAAFVLDTPPEALDADRAGVQLGIFPGSATPSVFPARAPFWIGYGFTRDPDVSATTQTSPTTRASSSRWTARAWTSSPTCASKTAAR